ncbi:DUF6783 domain-containing protein [Fusicatenibacter sp.]
MKNHFRNLQAPLCGIFCPRSVAVAGVCLKTEELHYFLYTEGFLWKI